MRIATCKRLLNTDSLTSNNYKSDSVSVSDKPVWQSPSTSLGITRPDTTCVDMYRYCIWLRGILLISLVIVNIHIQRETMTWGTHWNIKLTRGTLVVCSCWSGKNLCIFRGSILYHVQQNVKQRIILLFTVIKTLFCD